MSVYTSRERVAVASRRCRSTQDDESTVASEQPNVDEHGNVVVTYRQALGKEKKKRDGDDSDESDGDGNEARPPSARRAVNPATPLHMHNRVPIFQLC